MDNNAKCLLPQQIISPASVNNLSAKNANYTKVSATSRAKTKKKAVKTKGIRIFKKASN